MVTNRSCHCKTFQRISTQVGSIFFLFCFTCFVNLVTCWDYKVNIRIFLKCCIQSTIPWKAIILCCFICRTWFIGKLCAILSLTFGSTNLRVAYIKDLYRICTLCFIFTYVCLLTVFLNCVIISCIRFQSCNCYMIIFISLISRKTLIYVTGSSLECLKIIFICSKMNYRCCIAVTFLTIPCEIQLSIISTRRKRYLCKISCCCFPCCIPVRPSRISTNHAAVCIMICRCICCRTNHCHRKSC